MPGSLDKCLHALFNRASRHILKAFYFADIGITILTKPPISAVLALVVGRRDCQPRITSQQQTPLLLSQQLRSESTLHDQGTTGRLDFAGPPPSDGNFCGGYAPHKNFECVFCGGFPHAVRALMGVGSRLAMA